MSKTERPSFSNTVLTASELWMHHLGVTRLGKAAVSLVAGSSSEQYQQLTWLPSRSVHPTVAKQVLVPGDPHARRLARYWDRAAIIGVRPTEIEELANTFESSHDAVAYIQGSTVHVGILATGAQLFNTLPSEGLVGVGVRQGRAEVPYTLGRYNEETGHFASVQHRDIALVEHSLPIHWLPRSYPDVPLI